MQTKIWLSAVLMAIGIVASDAHAANVSDFLDFSLLRRGVPILPGRLYVPPEAATEPGRRPLILFLHGGGEQGTNNAAQVNQNIDNLLAEAKRRGAFLYAPQSPENWSSTATTEFVMEMIDRAISELAVDANRLYVTGLSNGGGGTWNMLSRYDGRFAAAVPICGVNPAPDFVTARLVDESIWAFHARDDSVVNVNVSRNTVSRILQAAGETLPVYPTGAEPPFFVVSPPPLDITYIESAEGGHAIWGAVYSFPVMYDWLFAHSLAVPEPSGLALAASGILLVAYRRRRG